MMNSITPLDNVSLFGVCFVIFDDIMLNYGLAPIYPVMLSQWFEEEKIGFYVGVITAFYFAVQAISSIWWGDASDKYGRRKTLIWSLIGNSIGFILFGFATSFFIALLARIISGALNGIGSVAKTYLGELTDESNAHQAFSKMGISYGLALVLGPLIGGYLSNPALIWSEFDNDFWNMFPYMLPVIVFVLFLFAALFYFIFYMNESKIWLTSQNELNNGMEILLTAFNKKENKSNHTSYNSLYNSLIKEEDEDEYYNPDIIDLENNFNFPVEFLNKYIPIHLRVKLIWFTMTILSLNVIVYMLYDVMISVYMEAPVEQGGLGFSAFVSGVFMSVLGLFMIVWQALFYGYIGDKLGTKHTILFGLIMFVLLYTIFPLLTFIDITCSRGWTYFVLCIMQLLRAISGSSSTMACQVLITQVTPPSILGRINGYATCFLSISKVISPLLAGSLWSAFQYSQFDPFTRIALTYWTFAIISVLPVYAVLYIPDKFHIQTGSRVS